MINPTTTADRSFRCPFCNCPVQPGDEIGFGTIKNKNREPAEQPVAICLPCWERQAMQEHGGYQEEP